MELLAEPLKQLNKYLSDKYGTYLDGRAWFRVVFANSQTELRRAVYEDFYGPIFIRSRSEIRETLKYPIFKDCYVLEKLIRIDSNHLELLRREISTIEEFTYECVWAFYDKDDNPLPVHRKILDFLIHSLLWPIEKPKITAANEQYYKDLEMEKEYEEYLAYFEDKLQSPLFENKQGVFIDSTKLLKG